MSTPERQDNEQRSSVKIATTAKGDATVEVKAYTHDLDRLDDAREKAVAVYKETVEAVR
jgi:hypothetical protein